MRIAAAIDLFEGSVVRLVKGDPANKVKYSDDPVATALKWQSAGADLLHVVDLDAAFGRGSNSQAVGNILAAAKVPVQVAGGIRSAAMVEEMISKNASKVVIGTMAYSEPEAMKKIAKKHSDRIVVSVDHKNGKVMVKGWTESASVSVKDAISNFRSMGVGEFLLTNVERDGTLSGPDTPLLSEAATFGVKIIASGGISSIEDVLRVRNAGASSVILGKALYDSRVSIEKARMVS